MNRVRNIVALIILSAITALVSGCTTTYQMHDLITPSKLERGENIYIALARDGSYGDTVYIGSGFKATSLLHAAIAPYSSSVIIGSSLENLNQALATAALNNCRYLMVPLLTNWEPRVAAWSGRPTRVSINISVYEVRPDNSAQIMNKNLDVTGRSATLVSQHPEEILHHLLQQFVQEAF